MLQKERLLPQKSPGPFHSEPQIERPLLGHNCRACEELLLCREYPLSVRFPVARRSYWSDGPEAQLCLADVILKTTPVEESSFPIHFLCHVCIKLNSYLRSGASHPSDVLRSSVVLEGWKDQGALCPVSLE